MSVTLSSQGSGDSFEIPADQALSGVDFDPSWIDDIVWVPQRVSRHTITNRWLLVDETRSFELVMKEKKAVTTEQCRVLVKGAPHMPLQLSCGPSIQFLYPTWQYLKLLDSQSSMVPDVPKERYREVEEWMLTHIQQFEESRQEQRAARANHSPALRGSLPVKTNKQQPLSGYEPASVAKPTEAAAAAVSVGPSSVPCAAVAGSEPSFPSEMTSSSRSDFWKMLTRRGRGPSGEQIAEQLISSDDDGDEPNDFEKAARQCNAPSSLLQCESMADFALSFDNIWRMWREWQRRDSRGRRVSETFDRLYRRRRALNKWQYRNRDAIFEQIKANRTVTAMTVLGLYFWLMHIVPFDIFLLLLVLIELLIHYVTTEYRDIFISMGRRAAKTRVDRVKDWFFFGVTRRKVRARPALGSDSTTPTTASPVPPEGKLTQAVQHPPRL